MSNSIYIWYLFIILFEIDEKILSSSDPNPTNPIPRHAPWIICSF